MAISFVEGSLRIRGPNAAKIRRFDAQNSHALLGAMKAVDFVIEETNYTIFLELKDPDNPQASNANRADFAKKLYSGSLDQDLKYKYRDSYLYEWSCGNIRKPALYIVVIQFQPFVSAHRMVRQDRLREQLPARSQAPAAWQQYYLEDVLVLDCSGWNQRFPNFRIERIS
ncbi:hypothetical protein [Candidatus Poriferisodalis sp.]|uniref:hypothetical protein n=1 Tax=Candidatus Poriferisodalis sp. TaxID=3101277 RepID=UPI003B026359